MRTRHVHRFFTDSHLVAGKPVQLSQENAFHASRVLRLNAGDVVEIADSEGNVFRAAVASAARGAGSGRPDRLEVCPIERIGSDAGALRAQALLTVIQAMPKGRKIEEIVEKLSEIGVERVIPVTSDRSVVKPGRDWSGKLARWRRVAAAAAAQAHRSRIMDVDPPSPLSQVVSSFDGQMFVLSTETQGLPLGEAISGFAGGDSLWANLTLVIGPEAGFSSEEVDMLKANGAHFVTLGDLVLRTETAGLVGATIAMHRMGLIG